MREIKRLGLEELVCKRKKEGKRGRKIGITTAEIMGKLYKEEDNQDVNSLFNSTMRLPTLDEEKKVFGKVLELVIVAAMKHQVYQFSGNTRKQEDGGPIGLELSDSIARVFMLRWDRQFLHLAKENGLNLH